MRSYVLEFAIQEYHCVYIFIMKQSRSGSIDYRLSFSQSSAVSLIYLWNCYTNERNRYFSREDTLNHVTDGEDGPVKGLD